MPEKDNRPVKVEVKNLTKKFGDLLVLDDMSFNIRKGEFVCVVGPTGCGKSTFLNCLTRIHMPTAGDIYIDGVPADPRKHNISFVFQEPSALPWQTVEQNIAYGLKIKKVPKDEIDRRVNQILDLMGLQESRKSYPGELSVSAEQRIIIGRSFAMQPDLLLMDEPYGQMDVKMLFYLEDEVVRLCLLAGLGLEREVLKGMTDRLDHGQLLAARRAYLERAAERYPLTTQLRYGREERSMAEADRAFLI